MNVSESKSGTLYLIPTPLGEEGLPTLPNDVITQIHRLQYFIMERAKTGRRFLRKTDFPGAIQELTIYELDKHQPSKGIKEMLQPALNGQDIGLMSEAGCPGVADPGALIVAMAHQLGIPVKPLVGPSSILLALMASGMNGQQFRFHGYLSPKRPQLIQDLKRLEQRIGKHGETQIFIETPYRNRSVVEEALQHLSDSTYFCVAVDLTLPTEWIFAATIKMWKNVEIPDLHKRPALFLIGKANYCGLSI